MNSKYLLAFALIVPLTFFGQEICDNGIDDDLDGLIDINDPNCDCTGSGGGNPSNIIPNPSFESFNCCPSSFAQMNCVDNWMQGGNGTSDYFNLCDYIGIAGSFTAPTTPPASSGAGYVGYSYTTGLGNSTEFVATCLNSPMLAGVTYTLTFDVSHGAFQNGSIDPAVVIYGTTDCSDLPWVGSCPTGIGSLQQLGSSGIVDLPNNASWVQGQINFTPSTDIYGIALGGNCQNVEGAAGYFYLDNLMLTATNQSVVASITELGGWCTNDLILSGSGSPSGGTWQWYKDGIALIGETNATLDVSNHGAGAFSAVYTVGSDCYRVDHQVTVPIDPIADFTYTTGCGSVVFTDNSSTTPPAQITGYTWNFGDGANSIDQNPTHAYNTGGTYQVTFAIEDDNGCEDSISLSITVPPFSLPTASNPDSLGVDCIGNVPPPDPNVVWDEAGTGSIQVDWVSDVSDGNSCPETITRTYSVTDDCGTINVTQIITINDTISPVIGAAPLDITVECLDNIPTSIDLSWSDNCQGTGFISNTDSTLTAGNCNGTILRTWSYTDLCGNSASVTQQITIQDTTPPIPLGSIDDIVLNPGDPIPLPNNIQFNYTDNCSGNVQITFIADSVDSSSNCDGISIYRTYMLSDICNNTTEVVQKIISPQIEPEASFFSNVQVLSSSNQNAFFTNTSTNATHYEWFLEDHFISNETNLNYTFPLLETGPQCIVLVAYNESMCSDTAKLILNYEEDVLIYVPNSFTPDADEFNNTFAPIISAGVDIHDYKLTIYNRWGETIFVSQNPMFGWDGTYANSSIVQNGTYVWTIEYKELSSDKRQKITGHVNLIR